MAAGVIYQTVTTTTGETVELAFYVDDTVTPTTWMPVTRLDATSPGVTALGQTTKAASLPVTIASDQFTAHGAVDASNPIKTGRRAMTALSALTLVDSGDRSDDIADLDGASLVRAQCTLGDIVSGNASNTDGASTEVLAAGAAGIKHYLTTIVLTNMHASSTIYVEIKDGATTKLTLPCPPGGTVVNLPVPLPGTAATAWNFDPSAATTTIYCSVIGFKSKV